MSASQLQGQLAGQSRRFGHERRADAATRRTTRVVSWDLPATLQQAGRLGMNAEQMASAKRPSVGNDRYEFTSSLHRKRA